MNNDAYRFSVRDSTEFRVEESSGELQTANVTIKNTGSDNFIMILPAYDSSSNAYLVTPTLIAPGQQKVIEAVIPCQLPISDGTGAGYTSDVISGEVHNEIISGDCVIECSI